VDVSPELVALGETNAGLNRVDQRVRFEPADVFHLPKHLRRTFNHVFCNPPFHGSAGESSPNEARARALIDRDGLDRWIAAAHARVTAGGTLTLIVRADRLSEALQASPQHGMTIFPLWPRQREPAKRALLQIRKNSLAPPVLLSGLVLHDESGSYTPEADAVLRDAASLALTSLRL
jgi:tRNA1(Val) A37 N6-methylase TrmN6